MKFLRASAAEKPCREWHAEQLPSDPSGLTRPIPELGQVAGSRIPVSLLTWITLPWHCQQPLTAAAEMPPGNIGVTIAELPSTTSASMLSSEPMMRPALEWCEFRNSSVSLP